MLDFKIYGTGCSKCAKLAEVADAAALELGLEHSMAKITDPNAIIDAGVVRTPALAVNGTIHFAGRVPSVADVKAILS